MGSTPLPLFSLVLLLVHHSRSLSSSPRPEREAKTMEKNRFLYDSYFSQQIAFNDNSAAGCTERGDAAEITVNVQAATYIILITGNADEGHFKLSATCTPLGGKKRNNDATAVAAYPAQKDNIIPQSGMVPFFQGNRVYINFEV